MFENAAEVLDFALADVAEAEARVEKFFSWAFDRATMATRGLFALAALLLAALVPALLGRNKPDLYSLEVVIVVGAVLLAGLSGLVMFLRQRRILLDYRETLQLYGEMKQVARVIRGR